jgi:hypothetical protein
MKLNSIEEKIKSFNFDVSQNVMDIILNQLLNL